MSDSATSPGAPGTPGTPGAPGTPGTGPVAIGPVSCATNLQFQLRTTPSPPSFLGSATAQLVVRVTATNYTFWLQPPTVTQQPDGSVLCSVGVSSSAQTTMLTAELGWVVSGIFLPIVNV